jgi:hypothetical protein
VEKIRFVFALMIFASVPVSVLAKGAEVVEDGTNSGSYQSKKEISVGAAVTPYDLSDSSIRIMHRPMFGTLVLELGNIDYVSRFKLYPGRIRAVDFVISVGYWSNEKKTERFGWHSYLGLGSAFLYEQDPRLAKELFFLPYRKLGLGLDFYPYPIGKNELGRKRVASFGLDLNVRNDANAFFAFKYWGHFNARLVYQLWFSK